ncbi:MAG: hypothetical protein CJBNEKGG_00916 [Prosthecobacter sp.]|nr:hypothetical protein [Prosthecobacter sp.]
MAAILLRKMSQALSQQRKALEISTRIMLISRGEIYFAAKYASKAFASPSPNVTQCLPMAGCLRPSM